MRYKPAILSFAVFFLIFLACEIGLRVYQQIRYRIPFRISRRVFYDPVLGWAGKGVFGDSYSRKLKIFVVGDSFTDGHNVEEGMMYYNVIKRNLDAEVFVWGGRGYGTLQEYLVIDRYLDMIKPDLILLQVYSNDFINNSLELESASYYNNNYMLRPYWIHGKIEYHYPGVISKLRGFFTDSRILDSLFLKFNVCRTQLAQQGVLRSVEEDILDKGIGFPPFQRASAVTDEIVSRIKTRSGSTPLIAFEIDDKPAVYQEQFKRIFEKNEIPFIMDVAAGLRDQEEKGIVVRQTDAHHLNEKGQQICGEILTGKLRRILSTSTH